MDDFIKIEALNIHQMMKKSPPRTKEMEEKKASRMEKENLTQRKTKHESERGENNFDRKAFHSPRC
jgi:hypothetical protein